MEHEESRLSDDADRNASSVEQDACDREAKKRVALDDFNKRTQRGIALVIIPFGVAGFISLMLLMTVHRAPNREPELSPKALNKALYDATLVHLEKLEREKADLEAEVKRHPNEARKLSEHEEQIRQTRQMLAMLAKKVGARAKETQGPEINGGETKSP
jgi:hypothetical protein